MTMMSVLPLSVSLSSLSLSLPLCSPPCSPSPFLSLSLFLSAPLYVPFSLDPWLAMQAWLKRTHGSRLASEVLPM